MAKLNKKKQKETKQSINSLGMLLSDTLRIGGINKSNDLLIDFIDQLEVVIKKSPLELQRNLLLHVEQLTQAHTRNDWLYLADIIQHHIHPLLKD